MAVPNASFNHIALSVPDGQAAVEWYTKVLGFEVVVPLTTRKVTDPNGRLLTAIYGEDAKEMKLAILSSGNDVGVEIFEFVDPPYNGPKQRADWTPDAYTRGGAFHFGFTVTNLEEKVTQAIKAGAKAVGEVVEPVPGSKMCYLQDPWGNTIELMNCTFGQLFLKSFSAALQPGN